MGTKKRTSNIVSATRDFVLRVIEGKDAGRIFALSKDRMIVGRSAEGHVDIEIHEVYAAPRHFEIYWDESINSHLVRDWGARNLVYINDHALETHATKELRLGDEIRIGNTKLMYEKAV
jgi:pSer/pThr/pTyr-binding forkhead associated (FHA) protein